MNTIKQPNKWSCSIASLAMLLDLSFDQVIQEIGHDGSELWWSDDPRPQRAFSIQELIDVALRHGIALIQIDGCPATSDSKGDRPRPIFPDSFETRLMSHMEGNKGLVTGYYAPDKFHMVAWDGSKVHDPMDGRVYSFDEVGIPKLSVESFYRAFGIKS